MHTSGHDTIILEAIRHKQIGLSKANFLFKHSSTRYTDSKVMDFIHGSADRFQNVRKAQSQNKDGICKFCKTTQDSPEHQLFYCTALDSISRQNLIQSLKNPVNYIQEVIFSGSIQLQELFYNHVESLIQRAAASTERCLYTQSVTLSLTASLLNLLC